jgi:hypothetical protein
MTKKGYNYKPITVIFDLDVALEAEMVKWLEAKKKKQNSISVQIKNIIKAAMEKEKSQVKFMASQGWKDGQR